VAVARPVVEGLRVADRILAEGALRVVAIPAEDVPPAVAIPVEAIVPVPVIPVEAIVPVPVIPVEAIVPAPVILAARRFSLRARTPVVADRRTLAEVAPRIRVEGDRHRIVLRMAVHRSGDSVRRIGRTTPFGPTTAAICVATMDATLAISTWRAVRAL
jgi:hypothetical protein